MGYQVMIRVVSSGLFIAGSNRLIGRVSTPPALNVMAWENRCWPTGCITFAPIFFIFLKEKNFAREHIDHFIVGLVPVMQ
jgi:hypothetical protein